MELTNPNKVERPIYNDNYLRYVGWGVSEQPFDKRFFSKETIESVKDQTTKLLKCVRSDGRPIIVSDRVISHVMSQIYDKYRPQLGDMYTMLTIPADHPRDDMKLLTDLVVETIYRNIVTETQMEENNKRLTVWTSVLGDFNEHGLRQYSTIRINKDNINKVRFNMNY